jgi:hypothetical protein
MPSSFFSSSAPDAVLGNQQRETRLLENRLALLSPMQLSTFVNSLFFLFLFWALLKNIPAQSGESG